MRESTGVFTILAPLAAAVLGFSAPTLAVADGHASTIEVFMPIGANVSPETVTVAGCDVSGMAITGAALILNCAPKTVYEVSYSSAGDGAVTGFGVLMVRDGAATDRLSPLPLVELVPSGATAQEARAFQEALGATQVPLAVSGEGLGTAPLAADAGTTPEPSGPVPGVLTLNWPTLYGTLSTMDGTMIELSGQSGSTVSGRISVPDQRGEVQVKSNRNDACAATVAFDGLDAPVEVAFGCREYALSLPTAAPASAAGCRADTPDTLSCLLAEDTEALALEVEGWGITDVAVDAASDSTTVDFAGLRPVATPRLYRSVVSEGMQQSCVARDLDIHVTGYCTGIICTPLPGGSTSLTNALEMPTLGESGWPGGRLPDGLEVQLVDKGAGAAPFGGTQVVAFGQSAQSDLRRYLSNASQGASYPLTVQIDPSQYKFGRHMRLYSDAQCTAPLEGRVDLGNPGNRAPDVPECSYFRIYDESKIRSGCTQVSVDVSARQASAIVEDATCSQSRVVVLVTETSSLNGRAGAVIVKSLEELASSMAAQESCLSVDIARTKDETREILYQAEDMYFVDAATSFQGEITMSFVNEGASVLRDFEWVYRTWGDNLAGVVLIADGSEVRPTDMIDSPAAMAWKIKNVATHVISFADNSNCEVFENTLLFAKCDSGELGSFESQLAAGVAAGLQAVRDSQE